MTATPEERAEGICAALARAEAAFDKRGWIEMPKADRDRYVERAMLAAELIAQAIRDAEDAALDKAADCVRDNFVNGEGHYAIEAITALKHSKETQA